MHAASEPVELVPCAACLSRRIDHPLAVQVLDPSPEQAQREQRRRELGLLSEVWDAHVHLFPDAFYAALHRWFDAHAWQIQFRGGAEAVLDHLVAHGIARLVALVFAHKPGVARYLNQYLGDLSRAHPQVVAVGTVLPGEPDAAQIVREAVQSHGLRGIKLHCHVMKTAIDSPQALQVLQLCSEFGVPAVVHAGREPSSGAYGVDTRELCSVARTRSVLQQLPALRLVVPHIGADEYDGYLALLDEFEHLHLDTAMACADYFAVNPNWQQIERHADRILYGTDFPIIPYDVDRELRVLAHNIVSDQAFAEITRHNAQRLWAGG